MFQTFKRVWTGDLPSPAVLRAAHPEPQCSLFGTGSNPVNLSRHQRVLLLSPENRNKIKVTFYYMTVISDWYSDMLSCLVL